MGSGLCPAGVPAGSDLNAEANSLNLKPVDRLVAREHKFHCEGVGPSTPSREEKKTSGQGECLFFLEFASDVPYRDTLRDLTCQAVSAKSHGNPYVRAWAEQDGKVVGRVAEWPARGCNESPSWYWAQPLGFSMAERSPLRLRLEVRDQQELLGSLNESLKDLPDHEAVLRDLSENGQHSGNKRSFRVSFQILSADTVTNKRTVWFVRHAESEWNQAQSKLDVGAMARTTDHPISLNGRRQAEALSDKLRKLAAMDQPDKELESLWNPDVVYTSPLTRAVQTTVIALGPMLTKQGLERDVVLMASSREKLNFGGFDTWSSKKGADIVDSTQRKLLEVYKGEESCDALKAFELLRFDAQEVQDQWWTEGMAETSTQLQARLEEFMSQLLYSQHHNIVVVGHSHFFRSVFKTFLSKEFKDGPKTAKTATDFANKKIDNCGVAKLELDPTRGLTGPIVSAQLVLGCSFDQEGGGAGFLSCCTAAGELPTNGGFASAIGEAEKEEQVAPDSVDRYEAAEDATGGRLSETVKVS